MNVQTESLKRCFSIQARVIGALLIREIITRYGRNNIGFLWLVIEPMLFTVGITIAWNVLKDFHGYDLPITAFALTGYSTLLLWRNVSNRSVKSIAVNLALLYHRNVKAFDLIVARTILEVAGATSSFVILTITFTAMGWMNPPVDILTAIVGWLLTVWFTFSLSLIIGAVSEKSELIERVWHIITYLILPMSGVFYMVDWLPKGFQNIVLWVPMVHGTEMIRHGFFGSIVHTHENPAYFIVINLVTLLFGLVLIKASARWIEVE